MNRRCSLQSFHGASASIPPSDSDLSLTILLVETATASRMGKDSQTLIYQKPRQLHVWEENPKTGTCGLSGRNRRKVFEKSSVERSVFQLVQLTISSKQNL